MQITQRVYQPAHPLFPLRRGRTLTKYVLQICQWLRAGHLESRILVYARPFSPQALRSCLRCARACTPPRPAIRPLDAPCIRDRIFERTVSLTANLCRTYSKAH